MDERCCITFQRRNHILLNDTVFDIKSIYIYILNYGLRDSIDTFFVIFPFPSPAREESEITLKLLQFAWSLGSQYFIRSLAGCRAFCHSISGSDNPSTLSLGLYPGFRKSNSLPYIAHPVHQEYTHSVSRAVAVSEEFRSVVGFSPA